MFSIVTSFELNPVHNPSELFDACRIAGIPELEVMQGMVSRISDRKLCLMCEITKRIPKARKGKGVAKTVSNRAPKGRILQLATFYAAIPEAHSDKGGRQNPPSPLD